MFALWIPDASFFGGLIIGESLFLFAKPACLDCDWLIVFYTTLVDYIWFAINALCNFTSQLRIPLNH